MTKKTKKKKKRATKRERFLLVEHPRLFLTYSETRTGGEICPGSEDDRFPDHEKEYIDVYFGPTLYRTQPTRPFFHHSVEVPEEVWKANRVWMVVVRYTDGGTFGLASGHWDVQGLFLNEDRARAWARIIDMDYEAYKRFGGVKKSVLPGFQAWKGYFAELDSVEVHEMQVQQEAPLADDGNLATGA